MDAKAKAKELVDKFDGNIAHAIIAVEEILKAGPSTFYVMTGYTKNNKYWKSVLTELKSI